MTFLGYGNRYLAGTSAAISFFRQMCVSIMNSTVLSACSAVVAQWFPKHGQPLATALSSLSNFIEIGIQFIMSTLVYDILTILLVQTCFSLSL